VIAGTPMTSGHVFIQISTEHRYYAHRLAWLYVHGRWPKRIDHKNGNPSDNRIKNLREASQRQNVQNSRKRRTNISGFRGVSWHPQSKMWRARIKTTERQVSLGLFHKVEDANRAYQAAATEHFGDFKR
jgi:hypothetical protein